jgi:membrane-bound lytic murein transglycosylase D
VSVGCAMLLGGAAQGAEPSGAKAAPRSGASAAAATSASPPTLPPIPTASAAPKNGVPTARPPRPASAIAQRKPTKPTKAQKPPPKSAARTVDPNTRRQVAGGPTSDDVLTGAETAELRALHDAERELFPQAIPSLSAPWPNEVGSPLTAKEDAPQVHASGLPPAPPPTAPPLAEGGKDLSWLAHLTMPDLPVRWDPRVIRFLEFWKDDPRGRQLLTFWLRRSGRYRDSIRRALRRKSLPEDLAWLAMIESGFDPGARSPAGAVGLWQFMPETGKLYGLGIDRWVDQRLSAQASTDAAVEFLSDLVRRFGSWELAVASYNMGYAGMMSLVRKYNTNDYWTLARLEGALPWETTLYVPKLIAAAILGRNLAAFGYADVPADPAIETDELNLPPGTSLASVATAAGCTTKEIEALNLELRAGRTPPAAADTATEASEYPVKVPLGKAAMVSQNLKAKKDQTPLERYVVKFGESLDQIAAARKVPSSKLVELNAIAQGEAVRGGTVLLVPKVPLPPSGAAGSVAVTASAPAPAPSDAPANARPTVIVPADIFVYPDRRRVFYRVTAGDTLRQIAESFRVSVDELRRWNDLDPAARLQEGMTLQVFVPSDVDLSKVVVVSENEARVIPVGSEDFFAYWEGVKGKRRVTVTAKAGDTLESIGRRNGVSAAAMERINRRSRSETLREGETVVLYLASTPAANPSATASATAPPTAPTPNGPLPPAPAVSALPELP